jgi:hypothetical protein
MAKRRMTQSLMVAVVALAGCADSDQILLGRERLQNGEAEDAEAPAAPTRQLAAAPPFAPCDPRVTAQLPIALRVTRESGHFCAGHDCNLHKLTPASDGSAWLVAGVLEPSGSSAASTHPWLAHFAADGSLLGELMGYEHFSLDFALDDRGQAWVLRTVGEWELTLQRFDAALQPQGAPIALTQGRGITALAGQGVVVLANASVSAYGYEGQLLWSHLTEAPNSVTLDASPAGFAVLNAGGQPFELQDVGVTFYDTAGTALWSNASNATSVRSALDGDWLGYHRVDQDSNLVLGVVPSNPALSGGGVPNPGLTGFIDITSIDPEGQPRWSYRVASSFNTGIALGPTGEVWVADFEGTRRQLPGEQFGEAQNGTIAVLAQDGHSCRRYAYDGIAMVNALEFSPTGELWFLDQNAFGRFALPTP